MSAMTAQQILDREFLEIRAKILEIAASLDRIQRAEGAPLNDPRRQKLVDGLRVLLSDSPDRAEQIQLIFSRDYDQQWQQEYRLSSRGQSGDV